METVADYIMGLCCAAVICSGMLCVGNSGGAGGSLRKMICGLFMAFVAISPLRQVDFADFSDDFNLYQHQAENAAQAGIEQTEDAITESISAQAEAYILDKAIALSLELEVQVSVDRKTMLPAAVTVTGEASPAQVQVLTDYIRDTLGIEENDQIWNN